VLLIQILGVVYYPEMVIILVKADGGKIQTGSYRKNKAQVTKQVKNEAMLLFVSEV